MTKYIAFEGLDGSGKTTISKIFVNYLEKNNSSVFYTKEPYSKEIESLIRKKQSDKSLLFLFLADRSIHIELLRNQKNFDFVVSDRSFFSTIAYQGYGAGFDIDFVASLNEFIVEGFYPEIVFYLDVDVKKAFSRIKKYDAIEDKNLVFFEKVRKGYLELAKKYNFFIINANNDINEVFEEVVKSYVRKSQ